MTVYTRIYTVYGKEMFFSRMDELLLFNPIIKL